MKGFVKSFFKDEEKIFGCGLEECGKEGARFEAEVEKDLPWIVDVYTDHRTGCKYLVTDTGVSPLLTEKGKPDCDPKRIRNSK
ncbi:DUF6440 family protein [Melghirimyces profundicolus]|uniref:DUF6440 family protein n=1 Tax=Melghirimyces profundicolus TaxID=1242148 RepID=UPI0011B26792|nr:DUF6440 family protein [Melghirimyces profundicolus]